MKESESMQFLFMTADLSRTVGQLTGAASRYSSRSVPDLFAAAVTFTIQLAIDAARNPIVTVVEDKARALERALMTKLQTWVDEEGALALRLLTHDISCVIGALDRAALRYVTQSAVSVVSLSAMETLLRNLAVAATAFTIQLAIEETDLDAVALRRLERDLIAKLEAPCAFGPLSLSVEAAHGKTWGPLKGES